MLYKSIYLGIGRLKTVESFKVFKALRILVQISKNPHFIYEFGTQQKRRLY